MVKLFLNAKHHNLFTFLLCFLFTFCFLGHALSQTHHEITSLTPLQKAESLLVMKRFSESIKAFSTLLDSGVKRDYVIRGLVRAYRESGRVKEGRATLVNRLSQAKEPSDFLYGLGYWFYLEGKENESKMYLEEAVEVNPNHALALNNLGAILSESGKYEQAQRKVKKALELNSSEPMFFQNLFIVYKNGGKAELFRREYDGYLNEGRAKLAFGYGKVLARNLRQKAFGYYSKGLMESAVESFDEIASIYKDINYVPGITAAWFSLGLLYEEQGEIELAKELFRKVLQVSPNHIQARQMLTDIEKGSLR